MNKLKNVAKECNGSIKGFKGFRCLRLKQIGKNSSDGFNMALSGIEFYGTGYGDWYFDESEQN